MTPQPETTESEGKKVTDLRQARTIAQSLTDRLEPLCLPGKCVIAGSIRREEPEVGDIEIVCIPRHASAKHPDEIFPRQMNLVRHHIIKHDQRREPTARGYKINKNGPKFAQVLFTGMQCDIFMTNRQQWGRMLALRTGPDYYSVEMASRWKDRGFIGDDGVLRRIRRDDNGNRFEPEFPTEESFFEFLGWEYEQPQNRG